MTTKHTLTPNAWVELEGTKYGKARVMPSPGSKEAGKKCWLTDDGMVDADGPVTVDYYEA